MTFSLPQKTFVLWLFRAFFVVVIVCLTVVKFCRLSSKYLLPIAILTVIGSAFLFVYIYIYMRSYRVVLDNASVVITKGVIIKTTTIIPNIRLAFVKSFATPIMVLFGLKVVVLKVARGWIFIPEIEIIKADCLIEMINNAKNDN